MAEYKTTVALEIGAQSVSMAVFAPAGKGFALSRYARRDIVLDPVEEGMRLDYMSNAIAELVAELKVKGSEIRTVVSGQQVFMRFIKLPALDMDDLREQVGYEAQQHIPFPIEEIVYSYQTMGLSEDGEREVLLVAMKKDVLDELYGQVQASGLRTKSVDCSISSLYNAYRASYQDTGCAMILDIGAKTTDILFSEGDRFFTRSVTAAGAFITGAIAREFRIGFREAEELKTTQGVVSMGNGHTDSMEAQQAQLATVIRTAMTRLSSEVQRTITHYRAQYGGSAPVKAYVCGGGARLSYAAEFLESTLNIPVEYLNPLAAFSLGKAIDEEAIALDALCLGPVAGAAVTGAKVGEFSIDLVPTVLGKSRAEAALVPKIIAAGCIAMAGAGYFAYSAKSTCDEVTAARVKMEASYEKDSRLASRVESTESSYKKEQRELEEIAALFERRLSYIDILAKLTEKSPSVKFWISEFAPLINYNVEDFELTAATDTKGTRLINMASAKSGSDSSINKAPEEVERRRRNDDPEVRAIYLTGYTLKDPKKGSNSFDHRDIIHKLVELNFIGDDSPFDLDLTRINQNRNRYFRFLTDEDMKGKMPNYVEKFMIILPLKKPILIPELKSN